jgi:signal transduction histidine kinase
MTIGAHDSPTQRLFTRLYARFGPRILFVSAVGTGAIGFVLIWLAAVWGIPFVDPSFEEMVVGTSILTAAALPVVGMMLYLEREQTALILSWDGAHHAREVWTALLELPFSFARRIVIVLLPLGLGVGLLTVAIIDRPVSVAFQLWAMGIVTVFSGFYPTFFALELALRPMLREVAAHLPDDFEPEVPAVSLRARTIAPLFSVSTFAALTAVGMDRFVDDGVAQQTLVIIAIVAAFTAAAAFYRAMSPSTLEPVEELVAASRRVAAGDLTTRVPLLAGDDLGRLAYSFNRMTADLAQRTEELQASRARVVAAGDAERRRVERDLHDGAQQYLVLLRLKLSQAEALLQRGESLDAERFADLRDSLDRALGEVRDLAHGIYPTVLETDGLKVALTEAAERAAIATTVDVNGTGRHPHDVEAAVYFCCVEALQNAAKHAGDARRATITLREESGRLAFAVADDGQGFDPGRVRSGTGLQNLADRVGALGGELVIDAAVGRGVTIRGEVPIS